MSNPIQEQYSDRNYCMEELRNARSVFTNPETTKEQYDQMEKALGFIYLYCPEDLTELVLSQLNESEIRKGYFNFKQD